jgi:hypothetical protein
MNNRITTQQELALLRSLLSGPRSPSPIYETRNGLEEDNESFYCGHAEEYHGQHRQPDCHGTSRATSVSSPGASDVSSRSTSTVSQEASLVRVENQKHKMVSHSVLVTYI